MSRRALPAVCSTDQYFGSPTTPANSQGATSIRFPGPSRTLGSVGRKRVYSERQADVKRNFRLREQKIRAPNSLSKPITRWLRNLQSSTDRNTGIQPGRK